MEKEKDLTKSVTTAETAAKKAEAGTTAAKKTAAGTTAAKKTAAGSTTAKNSAEEGKSEKKPAAGAKTGSVVPKKKKLQVVFRPQNASSQEGKNFTRTGKAQQAARIEEEKAAKIAENKAKVRAQREAREAKQAAEEAARLKAAQELEAKEAEKAAMAEKAAKAAQEEAVKEETAAAKAVKETAAAAPKKEEAVSAPKTDAENVETGREKPTRRPKTEKSAQTDRSTAGAKKERTPAAAKDSAEGKQAKEGRTDRKGSQSADKQTRRRTEAAPRREGYAGGSKPVRGKEGSEGADGFSGKKQSRDGGRRTKDKEKDSARKGKYANDREGQSGRPNQGRNQMSSVPKAMRKAPVHKPEEKKEKEKVKEITIPEKLTIKELADKMKMQPSVIVKKLFLEGIMATVNQEIDYEQAAEIALGFNILAEQEEKVDVIEELLKEEEEDETKMVPRPPVVCVMGHVDHGKTSLLDAIRDSHVTDREAGGITQHIGAYGVSINGQKITFLDTPGHEAFTAMRMRGANSTDIAILVVAADDGVMPQTVEAINHAKAAGVELMVAINKIDKPGANIDRVKQELTEYQLISEDWGGSTVFVPVSAKTREGIDDLLEMVLLTSEVLELKANPNRKARALVLEAKLDKGKGPVANILIQKGTLKLGDYIAAGACSGKVRAMMDEKGRNLKSAGPSTPVEVLGLNDVPNAGEILVATKTDKEAKNFAATFVSENKNRLLEETKSRMSLDDLFSQIQEGNLKELNILVKADVQGSVEAVKQSLLKLSNEEVVVKVIHAGVGAINESDVTLAAASNAIIVGFNVRPDPLAKNLAEQEGVDLRLYKVIYQAIEEIEAAMKGMLDPIFEERVIGHAEIRMLFKASGIGIISGSYVLDGIIKRDSLIRITREGKQIYEGKLASLKRFKDDVKEVKAGFECGLVFEGFGDVAELDQVEAYEMVEVPR